MVFPYRSPEFQSFENNKIMAGDILPDCRVILHTEESSYCVADYCVLNAGKLVGCPTVVPELMKYRLGGPYARAISNFCI